MVARHRLSFGLVVLLVLLMAGIYPLADTSRQPLSVDCEDEATEARVLEAYGKLPLLFIPNQGQIDGQAEYYTKASGHTLYFTSDGIVFDLFRPSQTPGPSFGLTQSPEETPAATMDRLVFSLDLVGAQPSPVIEGSQQDEAVVNYFIGNDPEKWHSSIPTYRELVYQGIYPNIDLRLYGNQGSLSYDFIVEPGGDVGSIRLAYTGVDGLMLDNGELVVKTAFGDIRQTLPYIYQQIGDKRLEIEGGFRLLDGNMYGFEVGAYDANYPLIIDPSLVYSTYLGGSSRDEGRGIAVDGQGFAYVTGWTSSNNFPTQIPYQGANAGGIDAFVTKLSASGDSLVYSTYLGGSSDDEGHGIAVDAQGSAYVTGYTFSTDFPTQNPYQGANAGGSDAFVTKLSASGSSLGYSTYLGGSSDDNGHGIAVDAQGSAYVTGFTGSSDFPTQNPYQGAFAGYSDVFVTKLSTSGNSLVYSTYLGGSAYDHGRGIAVDGQGSAYLTGETYSTDFPIQNPYQGVNAGGWDAFVAKLTVGVPPTVETWSYPIGGVTLISPYPGAGRPLLTVPVDPADITASAGAKLWGIYYYDETAFEWLYYIPGFTSTLTQLEPDKFYYVVVSAPCTLSIPQ